MSQDMERIREGGLLKIVLKNHENLNALSPQMVGELTEAVVQTEKEEDIRVVIITGSGKAFVAGADIRYMKNLKPGEAQCFAAATCELYRRIETSSKIYIAAINGFALGGGLELALACDIRLASTAAAVGLPEVGLGIIPGGGGTQRLPRLIGEGKALELILTGARIDAEEAYRLGIVNRLTEPEELEAAAVTLAEKILKRGPKAVSYAKEAVKWGTQMDMTSAVAFENHLFGLCFAEEEQKEGMAAFLEKRKPFFSVSSAATENGGGSLSGIDGSGR